MDCLDPGGCSQHVFHIDPSQLSVQVFRGKCATHVLKFEQRGDCPGGRSGPKSIVLVVDYHTTAIDRYRRDLDVVNGGMKAHVLENPHVLSVTHA